MKLSLIVLPVTALLLCPASSFSHDIITTPITWDREISRIVFDRCASCHHKGGSAFSLMTYDEGRPWAEAIKDEVLSRRMPPWGAVKGFGDFRDDKALTPEQLELIVSWAGGGAPEGDSHDLPPLPKFNGRQAAPAAKALPVNGELTLHQPLTLEGIAPFKVPDGASFQMIALRPDGSVAPLLWLYEYKNKFSHAFFYRQPVVLPTCTVIEGVPAGITVNLLFSQTAQTTENKKGCDPSGARK